jgi:hypothetical protein
VAVELLAMVELEQRQVRLLGLTLSNLAGEQLDEFVQLSFSFPAPILTS